MAVDVADVVCDDVAVELIVEEAVELAELVAVVVMDEVAVLDSVLDAVDVTLLVALELKVVVAVDDRVEDAVEDALVVPVDVAEVLSQPRSSPDCRWYIASFTAPAPAEHSDSFSVTTFT